MPVSSQLIMDHKMIDLPLNQVSYKMALKKAWNIQKKWMKKMKIKKIGPTAINPKQQREDNKIGRVCKYKSNFKWKVDLTVKTSCLKLIKYTMSH